MSINEDSVKDAFRLFFEKNADRAPTIWYTTLSRIKFMCRMNGLTIKQAGRLVKKVAAKRITPSQVIDYLSDHKSPNGTAKNLSKQ